MMATRFELHDYAASRAAGTCPAFVGEVVGIFEDAARGTYYHLRVADGRRLERALSDLSPVEVQA